MSRKRARAREARRPRAGRLLVTSTGRSLASTDGVADHKSAEKSDCVRLNVEAIPYLPLIRPASGLHPACLTRRAIIRWLVTGAWRRQSSRAARDRRGHANA